MSTLTATPLPSGSGVALTVAMNPDTTHVQVVRVDPSGFPFIVRGAASLALTNGQAVVYDVEAPMDVVLTYQAFRTQPSGDDTATSNTVQVSSRGFSWLIHPGTPTLSRRLDYVDNIAELAYAARQGVFDILGRPEPVAVSTVRGTPTSTLVFSTLTQADIAGFRDLFYDGSVLLLQTPAAANIGDRYLAVGQVTEGRIAGTYQELERRWSVEFAAVSRPFGLGQGPLGTRWADVKTGYSTWGELLGSGKTWRELLTGG